MFDREAARLAPRFQHGDSAATYAILARPPRCPLRVCSVAASSAMICIEERGGKPEQAGSVEPHRRIDPVSAGSFALRFRLGASIARVDRVGGISRRLDIAIAQVAAAYADLKRNNRIYFTRFRRSFSLLIFFLASLYCFTFFFCFVLFFCY